LCQITAHQNTLSQVTVHDVEHVLRTQVIDMLSKLSHDGDSEVAMGAIVSAKPVDPLGRVFFHVTSQEVRALAESAPTNSVVFFSTKFL
jgi:hypothetical protein